MIARYFASVFLGSIVTFSLLYLMQQLISMGEEAITPSLHTPVKFVEVRQDEQVKSTREPPVPPEEVQLPPTRAFPPDDGDSNDRLVIQHAGPPTMDPPGINAISGYGSQGDLLPIVAVAPAYPARALARHLEGYAIVEYTVTVTGAVRDAFIVASSNGIFDRPALEAAYKFKYKPRVVDGQPVETPGVQRKFSFVLEG